MTFSGGNQYFNPPTVVVRAPAALAGAGAYVASAEVPCAGFGQLTLYFTYDEDAGTVAGAVSYFVEVRPAGSALWHRLSVYAPGVVAAGVTTVSLIQAELLSFTPVGVAAEGWVYGPVLLGHAVEAFRVSCAESGAVGFPGVLGIIAEMGV